MGRQNKYLHRYSTIPHSTNVLCVYETVCNVPGGGWVVWEDYSLLTVATSPEWTQDWAQFAAARPPVETYYTFNMNFQ